jgi:catechol 2,3-dioxygenase-like lactoylglutathione lyase family enzyme
MTMTPSTPPITWQLDRVAMNVSDITSATRLLCEALGFGIAQDVALNPMLARLLGVSTVRSARLRRGGQTLELSQCVPAGAPIPKDACANDVSFQHFALMSSNFADDYQRLTQFAFTPITRGGPQTLPGGITAFKFRDPEGHPFELIANPSCQPETLGGIDHSAICVADPARSNAFYATLGLTVRARQVNHGAAQDALDHLDDVVVDVVALGSDRPGPHVELLGYRRPQGRANVPHPGDISASRLVFSRTTPRGEATDMALLRDPDGHVVILE